MTSVPSAQALPARRLPLRQSWLVALVLLIIAVIINRLLQPNFFRPGVISGNLQSYLPLALLAVGQTVIIIGGGVDLSLGAIVSLVDVVIVAALGTSPSAGQITGAIALGLLAGVLAGCLNGFCVAYLRFQPIVTTFASSFVFSGVALWVMPSPGGSVPPDMMTIITSRPLGVPIAIWIGVAVMLIWGLLRTTRFTRYLYAVGSSPMSAYISGVPVSLVRFSTYAIAGLMAAFAALALVLSTGTGDPLIGQPLTLNSIVAVVLGGTSLSGGQGGVFGSLIGVIILGIIRSIISFANVPNWWQTLIYGSIVVLILAGPGFVGLLRRRRSEEVA